MTKITFVEADGRQTDALAETGQTIMQVAVSAGVAGIAAECGGACACGTCHCYIPEDWANKLSPAHEDEAIMIEFVIEPKDNSRLSCQIAVTPEMDGLIVHVPASQT